MSDHFGDLKRHIGFFGLALFGIGDILGAGIYGLIGKAAGQVGNAIWMAFLVSALAALLTGLTYATLGSRYPRAAGASYVMEKAFNRDWLAYVVGLAILGSALTSMATAARILAGYLAPIMPGTTEVLTAAAITAGIALIVFWGIRESLWLNAICTLIELSGLLFIIAIGAGYLGKVDYFHAATATNPDGALSLGLVMTGAVLTFYSFIGFEDILNVAEEVKDPQHTLPRGLITAVVVSSLVYVLVSLVAVSVVSAQELSASSQPLVEVVIRAAPWFPKNIYSLIAIFAVSNTLLLNFIMSTRLSYGMAVQGLLPRALAKVHKTRKTPHLATIMVFCLVAVLSAVGAITQLARATSTLLLLSFLLMNIALIVLQRRKSEPTGKFEAPRWVPVLGAFVCAAMLWNTNLDDWSVAGGILAFIVVLYFIQRPSGKDLKSPKPPG
jgi:amino acid transporter